ncbi:hypothetical protein ACNQQN_24905 [Mycobacteroides chelonae]|uniref:hypothetical protein n=1 Tax=Mycobacteroides chelonae TaxID=1774 RepID=UPI003AAF1074
MRSAARLRIAAGQVLQLLSKRLDRQCAHGKVGRTAGGGQRRTARDAFGMRLGHLGAVAVISTWGSASVCWGCWEADRFLAHPVGNPCWRAWTAGVDVFGLPDTEGHQLRGEVGDPWL